MNADDLMFASKMRQRRGGALVTSAFGPGGTWPWPKRLASLVSRGDVYGVLYNRVKGLMNLLREDGVGVPGVVEVKPEGWAQFGWAKWDPSASDVYVQVSGHPLEGEENGRGVTTVFHIICMDVFTHNTWKMIDAAEYIRKGLDFRDAG